MNKAPATLPVENSRDSITHELIPYACHYSPDTLLTKNGELVQVIKLTNSGGIGDHEFRELIRETIKNNIDPSKFAVWVHTVRSKKEVKAFDKGDYTEYIDFAWRQHLPSEIHYVNEIYISIIMDSIQFEPWKMKDFLRSLSKRAEEEYRNQLLAEKESQLQLAANKIIDILEPHGAVKLGLYVDADTYHSEIMEFIREIMGIDYAQMALPISDLSVNLRPEHIEFNTYSSVFVVAGNHRKKFGVVISFKESIAITANALQDLLNSDSEFTICQSMDFAFGNKYLPAIRDQIYFTGISNDKNFTEASKLKAYSAAKPSDFMLQQTSITIISPTQAALDISITKIQKELQKLGIIAFLEDINSERAYWANLPGNFAFLKRQNSVPISNIANFASFGVDKYSSVDDCLFGRPVTFFETNDSEVFALHFLSNGQGHILLAGSTEDERQTLANLIAVQASGAGAEIILYDHYAKYSNFAQVAGAEYLTALDLDAISAKLDGDTKIIILNSIKPILDAGGHMAFCSFLEYAGSKNSIVICSANYEENCELLLQNFTTTVFYPCEKITEIYADNYDCLLYTSDAADDM
jgi:type IV secretion system protein VirB4